MCTNPKLRRTYPKLWRQLPIGTHKFRVGYLIFELFKNKYVIFSLPWPPKVTRPIAFLSQCQGPLIYTYLTNW